MPVKLVQPKMLNIHISEDSEEIKNDLRIDCTNYVPIVSLCKYAETVMRASCRICGVVIGFS